MGGSVLGGWVNVDKGHHKEKVKGVIFNTKEDTEIILQARNINIDILEHGSAEQGIIEIAEKMPELAWLKKLKNDPNVNWSEIEAIHDEWNDKTEGLSQVGMLLVTIAVAIAAGPAAGALGSTISGASAVAAGTAAATSVTAFSTAMGAMAAAGFSSIVSQAAVSLINNQGDLGSVLKELTSSDSLRGLAVSMATAGAMQGIGDAANWADHAKNADKLSLGQRAANGAIRAGVGSVVRAGTGSLLNGQSFTDSLEANLESAAIGLAGELVANEIGSQYDIMKKNDGGVSFGEYIAHKAAHGALGCAMGLASGGNCAGGAIGSVTAETIGEILVNRQLKDSLNKSLDDNIITALEIRKAENYVYDRMTVTSGIATSAGIIAAEISGNDINSANLAGRNSVENNLYIGVSADAKAMAINGVSGSVSTGFSMNWSPFSNDFLKTEYGVISTGTKTVGAGGALTFGASGNLFIGNSNIDDLAGPSVGGSLGFFWVDGSVEASEHGVGVNIGLKGVPLQMNIGVDVNKTNVIYKKTLFDGLRVLDFFTPNSLRKKLDESNNVNN